ncbi:hypothetical protein DFJ74DRAFT_387264 [Hyaloraphidium curvatum]|nr:hypothetical protein DFJ74DRAFT_387264 [Hyaloraphidium curvatum]
MSETPQERRCELRKHAQDSKDHGHQAMSSTESAELEDKVAGGPVPPLAALHTQDEPLSAPGDELAVSMDIGLATFWERLHPTIPIVHRTTFNAAMASSTCPIYHQRPRALAFAMASCGILYCSALPSDDRVLRSTALSDAASDVIASAYDRAAPISGMTNLEAAQAAALLVQALAPQGHAHRAGLLLRTAVGAVERMLPRHSWGTPRFAHLATSTGTVEWVEHEMTLRTYILVASLDVSFSIQAHRHSYATYFDTGYMPLPRHDSLFDQPDPLYRCTIPPLPPAFVDPAPLLRKPRPETFTALIAQFVGPALSYRASHFALRLLTVLCSVLCAQLTGFARSNGVDPLRAVALPDSDRDTHESAFASHAALLVALGRAIASTFPDSYGTALARGDATTFLADEGRYFSHHAHATAFLASAAGAAAGSMNTLLVGCDRASGTDQRLWTAPVFASILADAALFMRTLRSAGGELFGLFDLVPHVVRAGALALAGRRLVWGACDRAGQADNSDPGDFVADIRTAEGFLEASAVSHGGLAWWPTNSAPPLMSSFGCSPQTLRAHLMKSNHCH